MASTTEHDGGEVTTPYVAQQETEVPDGAAYYEDAENNPDAPIQLEREGHLCCGKLFDMRVGTIVANCANALLKILCIAFDISWGDLYPVGTAYCSLILSMIAIFGALYFEPLPAYLSAGAFAFIAGVHMFGGAEWFAVVWDSFIVYPTVVLAYQIQKGVMTEGTYKQREEYIAPEIRLIIEKVTF